MLPSVTEDIKWGNDLCFLIGGKIFCVVPLEIPLKVSLKVTDEEYDTLTEQQGIIPAPYAARNKWILVENANLFAPENWKFYITQSYNMVRARVPKGVLNKLD